MKRRPFAIVPEFVFPASAGILIAGAVYFVIDRFEQQHLQSAFMVLAERDTAALAAQFDLAVAQVKATGQLYNASREVDQGEFTQFVSGLQAFPAVSAYEWLPVVPHAQRQALESGAVTDGLAGYRITERGPDGLVTASRL